MAPDLDQLYTAYKAGRPRGEDRLSAEVWRRVHGVLRAHGASDAEADEFAQDATRRIMSNLQAKAVEKPSHYVARAASMVCRDMGRRRKARAAEVPVDPHAPSPEGESVEAWQLSAAVARDHAVAEERVARILNHPELSHGQRAVLRDLLAVDVELESLTDAEVVQAGPATRRSTARNRVDKRWQRARDRVLRLFSEWQAED